MIENPISSTSLYNQCSTLNYTQAAMMGLTGSSLQDSQQLGYGNHGNIPNIILTGSSTSSSELESLVTFYSRFWRSLIGQIARISRLLILLDKGVLRKTPNQLLRCCCCQPTYVINGVVMIVGSDSSIAGFILFPH